jgi:hypothetical protein
MRDNSEDKFSQTTQIFIRNICSGIPDPDFEDFADELKEFTTLINLNRHRIKDHYLQGLGNPEDQKANLCLIHAYNRLIDLDTEDEGFRAEYNLIVSELRQMNETARISEELYRNDSENNL